MNEAQISKMGFALDAAARGLPVFPLKPNSNVPLIPNWREVATTDPEEIRACWELCPDANIGIATTSFLVLYLQEDCGPESIAELKSLFAKHSDEYLKTVCGLSASVSEGRGKGAFEGRGTGAFALYALPSGAAVKAVRDKLAPSIGVLSSEDFLVGPGSVVGDINYEFANARSDASRAPPWLMEMCGVQLPAEGKKTNNVIPLKKPAPPTVIAPAAIKTKLDWALEAAEYIRVHPVVENTKAATITDWPNRATQDPKQIREWWKRWPNANIGGATDDLIVIDIDKDKGGYETFAAKELIEHFPETKTTDTQGGGKHLFYASREAKPVKGGTDKLGPGLDIKSRGGYVLMPGSTIDGRAYTVSNDRQMAFAPQWLVDELKAAKPKKSAAGKRIVEEDDTAIDTATKWMRDKAPTAEEGYRDNTAYKVVARVYDYGVTNETALEIMISVRWS